MRRGVFVLSLALAGCSNVTLDQVRQMTADDLANATAKAAMAKDLAGQLCWDYLAAVPSPQGATSGVASDIEDARIIAIAAAGPCSGILGPVIMLIRP
jgi:hypothetical protein